MKLVHKKEKRNRHKPKIKSDLNPEAKPFIPKHLDISAKKDPLETMFDELETDRVDKIDKIVENKSAEKRALKCEKLSTSPFKNTNRGVGGTNESVPVQNVYIQLHASVICMSWFSLFSYFVGCPSHLIMLMLLFYVSWPFFANSVGEIAHCGCNYYNGLRIFYNDCVSIKNKLFNLSDVTSKCVIHDKPFKRNRTKMKV